MSHGFIVVVVCVTQVLKKPECLLSLTPKNYLKLGVLPIDGSLNTLSLVTIRTLEPWNLGVLENFNLGALEPWRLGAVESWNLGALLLSQTF